jgi:Ala-tRNA(Pro) deacylase
MMRKGDRMTMQTITEIPDRILAFLNQTTNRYAIIMHRRDYTAREAAADTYTPNLEFAKTVVLRIDEGFALAVLPAHHRIDMEKLRSALEATQIDLASEATIRELFPNCEVGAEPPLGNLYGLPVIVSAAMALDENITFNAGTHDCAIQMRYADFERLVKPRVINFSIKAGG